MNLAECAANAVRAGFVLAAAGLLFGCSVSSNPNAATPCPKLIAAPGADSIVLFGPGGHDRRDVIIGGKFYSAAATCRREDPGFAVNTEIEFYAERVNLLVKDTTFPYFVALVDPQEHVMAQESYQVSIQFLPGESYRRTPVEKITVHLPVRNRASATSYAVIVGFQLTPDQIAFNRSLVAR
jgi:hypothetical protein